MAWSGREQHIYPLKNNAYKYLKVNEEWYINEANHRYLRQICPQD